MSRASAAPGCHRRVLAVVASLLLVGLSFLCAAVLAVASPGAGATSSSAPSGAPNGHHVVHDVHCEPFTGAEAAATVHRDPSSQPLPAVDLDMPGDGSWITTEATTSCAPDARSGSLSPGREVLLAVGVDRN